MRHDIRGEKFAALGVVPSIGVDQQIDAVPSRQTKPDGALIAYNEITSPLRKV
jgi:hypothetical protein